MLSVITELSSGAQCSFRHQTCISTVGIDFALEFNKGVIIGPQRGVCGGKQTNKQKIQFSGQGVRNMCAFY